MNAFAKATAAAALCAVFVSGCANTASTSHWGPQPDLPRPLAAEMPVEVRVGASEIAVHVAPGNAMAYGGGLLGVLVQTAVDSSRARGAEGRVAQIRDMLVGNDYRQVSGELVEAHLDRGLVAPVLHVETSNATIEQQRAAGDLATRRNVMVIEHDYYFNDQFTHLQVELIARIGDRVVVDRRVNEENMRYYNRFQYTAPLPGGAAIRGRDERAEAWFALGGEAIDGMIREGLRQTIEMLNYDLAGAQGEVRGERTAYVDRGLTMRGVAVKRDEGEGRVWVRGSRAPSLHSVPAP